MARPFARVENLVWDTATLAWVAMTQPGGSTGGGGDASAANQVSEIAKLTSIDGKITAVNTGAVVVSSSVLPAGAATGTKQDTGNTSLSNIDTKTPALGQALAAASVPVVLTAAQVATLTPVTGLTDTQLRASAVPISGTVSGPLTDTQLRASAVPVLGPVTDTQLRASAVPVSLASVPSHAVTNAGTFAVQVTSAPSTPVTGTFFQATQPISAVSLPLPTGAALDSTVSTMSGKLPASVGQKTMAASLPIVIASDQGPISIQHGLTGATNVFKTGTITTTLTTADQVVLTYTVTALKTFYLQYLVMYGRFTVLAATATILGAISLETPSGTKCITFDDVNPTTSELEFNPLTFSEPIPIAAGTVVRVVVTPAAATSMLWRANFGGYEK